MSTSDVPPPLKLKRSGAQILTHFWTPDYCKAMRYWENAQKVFPEFFNGTVYINVYPVTATIISELRHHFMDRDDPWPGDSTYRMGEYIGKINTHVDFESTDFGQTISS